MFCIFHEAFLGIGKTRLSSSLIAQLSSVCILDNIAQLEGLDNGSTYNTGYFRKVYRDLQVRVPRNILKYLPIRKYYFGCT